MSFLNKDSKNKLPQAPLLARSNGSIGEKDTWKYPIKDAVIDAKLPETATMYTIWHSVITDLIHGGLDTLTVAQLSGTSIIMIEMHYGHLAQELQEWFDDYNSYHLPSALGYLPPTLFREKQSVT